MAETQAGWFNDGSGTMRWWDGKDWTDKVQPPPPRQQGPGGFIDRIATDAVAGASHVRRQEGPLTSFSKSFSRRRCGDRVRESD